MLRQFRIFFNGVGERRVALGRYFFGNAVVALAPPAVVDVVFVVTRARYGHLEEIGIYQHGSGRHEAPTGMPGDTHAVDVDEWVAVCQLLGRSFLIGETIVAQVAIP